jgi:signal recognition particle subunit SRP54
VVVLLAGLQGAGKTTTAGKLARLLMEQKKRVLLVSTDIRRPAAVLQLQRLAEQVGAGIFPTDVKQDPARIARDALEAARKGVYDALIVDTAGRLHVDTELMEEVKQIERAVETHERLFVIDAMAGQDAVNAARAFSSALDLTGVILTKADGDARGGAALSVREVTGKPIVLVGMGEKLEALEAFDAERMAGRILGMGDVVALVEQVQKQVDVDEAQKLAKKVAKGKGFDLVDLKNQLEQLQKMGGVGALMDKLPQAAMKGGAPAPDQGDREVRRQIAIINSMTKKERRTPALLDGSRRRRIAAGAGVQVQDVNKLMKQFMEMQKMMKSFAGGKLKRMMQAFKGQVPPGFPGIK